MKTPSGQYSQDRGSLPSPVTCLPPQSLSGGPHSQVPPPTRTAGQPELGFSQTTVTPRRGAGFQQLGSLLLWTPQCHFPLRHLHPTQPHWTPPSLTAALGTIPAVHWLLPRQPRATPLPIGPALFRAIFVSGPVYWESGPKI